VAAVTEGCSGAELANVVNEAALLAAREQRDEVGWRPEAGRRGVWVAARVVRAEMGWPTGHKPWALQSL
jgi:hypothetical protein